MFTAPRLVVRDRFGRHSQDGGDRLWLRAGAAIRAGAVSRPRTGIGALTFSGEDVEETRALAGLSVPAVVRHDKTAFEEGLLFTHRGLSRPSILRISAIGAKATRFRSIWHREARFAAALKRAESPKPGGSGFRPALARHLPERFGARRVVARAGVSGRLADQTGRALDRAGHRSARNWRIRPPWAAKATAPQR